MTDLLIAHRAGGRTLAVLAACSVALTACSTGTGSEDFQVLVQKDISTWALPSDAYASPALPLQYYAVGLKAQSCEEAAGLHITTLRFDPNGPLPQTSNAVGRRIFNERIAQKFGYHEQLDPRINWEDRKAAHADTSLDDDTAYKAFIACEKQAARDLGADPDESSTFGFPTDPQGVTAVRQASATWRECMAPLGISDLSPESTPNDMPTASLSQEWGLNLDSAPWEVGEPGQDEIRTAVHDAQCRESSGWSTATYDAEWDQEMTYLRSHYRNLESQRARYERLRQTYLDTIGNLGQSGA